jgi:hypothetical protein
LSGRLTGGHIAGAYRSRTAIFHPRRETRVRASKLTAGLLLSALVLAAAGCSSAKAGTSDPKSLPSPSVSRGHSPEVDTVRGPTPPAQGVWLGAWVKPDWSTPEGRAAAFAGFEDQLGAQLPIAHNFQDWSDEFPGAQEKALLAKSDVLMISWSGTDTRSIVQGSYDANIRHRAQAIKDSGLQVLLRFRWEMDRPNLAASVHSPEDYVAAWKHVRRIFSEVGATNAGWVWCPHVTGFVESERNAAAYYPGDDQVEWMCADVYAGKDFLSFGGQMDSFLAFAQSHDKPIIVGEYGVTEPGTPGQRAAWMREVRTYVKAHPQVKALVYFAAKQDRKPVYDSTFTNDPDGLAAFREMASDPYFQAPPPETATR